MEIAICGREHFETVMQFMLYEESKGKKGWIVRVTDYNTVLNWWRLFKSKLPSGGVLSHKIQACVLNRRLK